MTQLTLVYEFANKNHAAAFVSCFATYFQSDSYFFMLCVHVNPVTLETSRRHPGNHLLLGKNIP